MNPVHNQLSFSLFYSPFWIDKLPPFFFLHYLHCVFVSSSSHCVFSKGPLRMHEPHTGSVYTSPFRHKKEYYTRTDTQKKKKNYWRLRPTRKGSGGGKELVSLLLTEQMSIYMSFFFSRLISNNWNTRTHTKATPFTVIGLLASFYSPDNKKRGKQQLLWFAFS